jgi:hypothetical protein
MLLFHFFIAGRFWKPYPSGKIFEVMQKNPPPTEIAETKCTHDRRQLRTELWHSSPSGQQKKQTAFRNGKWYEPIHCRASAWEQNFRFGKYEESAGHGGPNTHGFVLNGWELLAWWKLAVIFQNSNSKFCRSWWRTTIFYKLSRSMTDRSDQCVTPLTWIDISINLLVSFYLSQMVHNIVT